MSDENNPTEKTDPGAAEGQKGPPEASVHALVQYVRDLSFENPNPVEAFTNQEKAPEISVNCQIGTTRISEDAYEVALHVDVKAARGENTVFLVELQYAGVFQLRNVPNEHIEPILYIHCPTLLFPFVRQIVAEVTRNGGYPQLLIEMVDFTDLYRREKARIDAELQAEKQAG